MRKVTEQTVNAFINGNACKVGNTETNGIEYRLHGHKIAYKENGHIYISNCGYVTAVTKERLNGILWELNEGNKRIYQKNYTWYWNGNIEFPSDTFVQVK